MSDIEAVVLDLDGGDHLDRCIASLSAQTHPPQRVIIFDNGSVRPVRDRLPDAPGLRLEILRSETNLGFAGGINEAMKSVGATYVAWINNDVVLAPTWLETLVARLDHDPMLGAVQSSVMSPSGEIDGAGIDISDGTYRQLGRGLRELDDAVRSHFWGVSGTAVLFRRDALHAASLAGGLVLHPAFFAWYEDVELGGRLREAGWRAELVDEPLAVHVGSQSAPQLGQWGRQQRIRNRYLVRRLHPSVGRWVSLLAEDARRFGREVAAGDYRGALLTAGAVFEGAVGRIDASWRGRPDF